MKNYPLFFLLGGLLICAFLADIAIGSVNLSLSDVWATLTGNSDTGGRSPLRSRRTDANTVS